MARHCDERLARVLTHYDHFELAGSEVLAVKRVKTREQAPLISAGRQDDANLDVCDAARHFRRNR